MPQDCVTTQNIYLASNHRYRFACVPIEDSDQPAHPRSLIKVFDGRSMESQGSYVSSGATLRLWSDCAGEQTEMKFRCTFMQTSTLCWLTALIILLRHKPQIFVKSQNVCLQNAIVMEI